jgi:hypothetical protein
MKAYFKKFNDSSNWVTGSIEGKSGIKFEAKLFDNGSQFGINNGRVSKLDIRVGNSSIISYDRGWVGDSEMASKCDMMKNEFNAIMELLENSPQRFTKENDDLPT